MSTEVSYPAKLLLFGEYSILLGSSAIGMPVNAFTAQLNFIEKAKADQISAATKSNLLLKQLCNHYLERSDIFGKFLNLDHLRNDVSGGLYLASTIPQRFGLGSSGALCAAVYGRYRIGQNDEQMGTLRERFIDMESFFHGKSSGFDPLVIYLQKPLLLNKKGEATVINFFPPVDSGKFGISLLDSGLPRAKNHYVKQFMDEYAPAGKPTNAAETLIGLTNSCIETLAGNNIDEFWKNILNLSGFQLKYLSHLIPSEIQSFWSEGLESGMYALKLCGSGGGGYFICFTSAKEITISYFMNNKISVIEF